MPHLYHYITVYDKRTGRTTTEKHYSGGPQWGARGETWWSTYRFVARLSVYPLHDDSCTLAVSLSHCPLVLATTPTRRHAPAFLGILDTDTNTLHAHDARPVRRYQLEAFVDMVRGREPAHWITLDSSIAQMDTIDTGYEKAGLGRRMPTPE